MSIKIQTAAAFGEKNRLRSELRGLELRYRQSLVEHILDLNILAGTKKEEDREQESIRLMDPKAFPLKALEEMQKSMMATLRARVN
jgi:hypothetical protein